MGKKRAHYAQRRGRDHALGSVDAPLTREDYMGTKPSNNFQSDRPESGGADRRDERENSGLLGREKEKFAAEQAEKERSSKQRARKEEEGVKAKSDVNPATRKKR